MRRRRKAPEKGDTPAKENHEWERNHHFPKSREEHNVLTYFTKHPDCEVCKMTKITWARKPGKNAGGIVFVTQFGDAITAGHTILNVENESRPRRKWRKPCWNSWNHSQWGWKKLTRKSSSQPAGDNSMRDCEAHSSGGKSSPVAPAAGLGEEIPGEQKHHRVPSVRRPRCALIIQKIPMCEVCERTKSTRARSETKPKKRTDGLARIHKIWTSSHGSPQNSERGKWVKVWAQKCSNRTG